MRLLLDESVPRRLKRHLPGHEVHTVVEMGWSGTKNGRLLALAAEGFDAFITVDQNLPHQQNLDRLPIAVVLLVVRTNTIEALSPLAPRVLAALLELRPRSIIRIGGG